MKHYIQKESFTRRRILLPSPSLALGIISCFPPPHSQQTVAFTPPQSSLTPHPPHSSKSPTITMPDQFEGIDFEELNEATGLATDEIKCLKVCFDLFDTKKVEFLSADDLGEIMRAMGFRPTEEELKDLLAEIDEDGSGEIEFGEFCQLCATFLVEDPDMETMKRELKDAFRLTNSKLFPYLVFTFSFQLCCLSTITLPHYYPILPFHIVFQHRLYDKEGQGFISTDTLRGLISELLAPLTEEELEGILEELDEDGSGSMDFDEFCEMMMTKPED